MKKAMLGALVVVGLVVAAYAGPERVEIAPRATGQSVAAAGDLIVVSTVVADRYQQLTVIDPKSRSIGVYHVELGTGNVRLCCVRSIQWDLQMMHYNGDSPLPREIQSLVQPK